VKEVNIVRKNARALLLQRYLKSYLGVKAMLVKREYKTKVVRIQRFIKTRHRKKGKASQKI